MCRGKPAGPGLLSAAGLPPIRRSQQTAPTSNAGSAYECDAEFTAPAEVSTVTAYLRAQLDSGDWTLVTADSRQGVLAFKRQSDSTISGQVEVLARGDKSLVEVQIVNR